MSKNMKIHEALAVNVSVLEAQAKIATFASDAYMALTEFDRGLDDMKRRGLLGFSHCPADALWIERMCARMKKLLEEKGGENEP